MPAFDFFTAEGGLYLGVTIYAIVMVLAFLIWRQMRKGKIRVRLLTPLGPKVYWKKPETDGRTIVMRAAKGKKIGWSFTFDQTYPEGRNRTPTIDVNDGASQAIHHKYKGTDDDEPVWDRKTEEELFNANVIRAAGTTGQKLEIPISIYLLLVGSLVLGFFTILVASGRIRM